MYAAGPPKTGGSWPSPEPLMFHDTAQTAGLSRVAMPLPCSLRPLSPEMQPVGTGAPTGPTMGDTAATGKVGMNREPRTVGSMTSGSRLPWAR